MILLFCLGLAKDINLAHVKDDIDRLNGDLTSAADNLKEKTNENSGKIRKVFNAVYASNLICYYSSVFVFASTSDINVQMSLCRRSALITVAVVMLLISILGLCTYYYTELY
ncbi:hypothetical protein KY284_023005 [Solanum tuberosum]|nr:hypothetical protein KY284_023005 [Solanum tuberosum]